MVVRNKRGDLTVNNTVGLIIAVAGIMALLWLFFALIAPTYDEETVAAKSYSGRLEVAIEEANDVGEAEFSVITRPDSPKKYFLVFFNERNFLNGVEYYNEERTEVSNTRRAGGEWETETKFVVVHYLTTFYYSKRSSNTVCICSTDMEGDVVSKPYEPFANEKRREVETKSTCTNCVNLDWSVTLKSSEDKLFFDLNEYKFNIKKEKDEEMKTQYVLEVNEK